MKITHVISDSNIGGAGILLSSVVSLLKNDFDFEIIIPKGARLKTKLKEMDLNVTELAFRPDQSFSPIDTLEFYKYFKCNHTDILHTHASLSSRLGGKLSGIAPCISTRHCSISEAKIKKHSFLKRMIYNFCTDITVSTADFATANLIGQGLKKKNIITIKNGSAAKIPIDANFKEAILDELKIDRQATVIGICARLEEVKGQDIVLRAIPFILKEFPDCHFLFLGDGSKRKEYQKLTSFLGIGNNVTFLGFVEKPYIYQSLFHININASRGTETSCLATSECMALGIPTIASDFGGNTEMITDMENGMIFGSDNPFLLAGAVIKLLSDDALYTKLSRGAEKSFKEQFSAEIMAENYRRLYRSISPRRQV